jgi:CheY-like chemotaxis protein
MVMAYRDFTGTSDGSIAHARDEFRYAAATWARCGLVVGQQYGPAGPDEQHITFNGQPRSDFLRAAAAITTAFRRSPSSAGCRSTTSTPTWPPAPEPPRLKTPRPLPTPVGVRPVDHAGPQPPPAEEMGRGFQRAEPSAPLTVLYIEDNLSNLQLVEQVLRLRPAVRLIPAMRPQLGLDLAAEHDPDLVLLDLHLPDMSGQEVLRRLRAQARTANVPVVVLSADARPSLIQELLARVVRAFLTKPLDVRELLELLDVIAAEQQPTSPAAAGELR